MNKFLKKGLSLVLCMALVLAMSLVPVSAATIKDLSPADDPLLGTQFDVDATIILANTPEGQEVSVSIPVRSMNYDALKSAAESGSIKLNLLRDESRPYVNEELFPYAYPGGPLEEWVIGDGETPHFTNIEMEAVQEGGSVFLNVSFIANNWFFETSWWTGETYVSYAVPHIDGGYYIDYCGYFNLTAVADGRTLGSAPVKVAPYENFHTMWETYKEISEIAKTGTKNGLYAVELSMGQSTAGRNMPYLIVADKKSSVDNWLALTEEAETNPDAVLAKIKNGQLDDIRVPVLYSNIHSNEVAAVDGVITFAKMLVSEAEISYDMFTGFTAAGKAQLAAEMGPVGAEGSVAIPDLVKDTASYLGFITDENNGISGVVDLEKYYNIEKNTINVKDELLKDVFFILVPEENVDGRTYLTRHSSGGYDLNRDNSFQTTSETANMQALISKYNPVSLTEFHGSVPAFQCEPCDPPHEPNFEYDLLAEHLIPGGEALGIAAVANNDTYNSYVIPQRDYLVYTGKGTQTYWADPWDDMSTSYTPQFAMLHGTVAYTVELPGYNDAGAQLVHYGIIGNAAYVAENKLSYLENQTKIYKRGVENFNSNAFELVGQWFCDQYDVEGAEMDIFRPVFDGAGQNGNFYPECYIIPLDGVNQKNIQAAANMMEWLARNDVKLNLTTEKFTYNGVEYPAGTLIVSMYQAKRSVANGALYDGTLINGWTILYSEGITTFNETRGFDMVTVAEPAAYKTIAAACGSAMDYAAVQKFLAGFGSFFTGVTGKDVIISNASEDSTMAVNELLKAGKKVGMVTSGKYKGDFICSYADYLTLSKYLLSATGIDGDLINAKVIEKSPVVYVPGTPPIDSEGFVYTTQIGDSFGWNYDMAALSLMGFDATDDVKAADAVAGVSALEDDALAAVKGGMPYVGYSAEAATELVSGVVRVTMDGAMDCLAYVTYPNNTLVNASYAADGDDVMYGYGHTAGWDNDLGYFTSIPKGAKALVAVDGSKMPTEGFIPLNTEEQKSSFEGFLNGGILGYEYNDGTLNFAIFANSLTHKVHQRDEYAFISNFLFSSMLTKEAYGAMQFDDVSADAYYAEPVLWAYTNNIVSGTSTDKFSPKANITREQFVTMLYRYAQSIGADTDAAATAKFTDAAKISEYAVPAVEWAFSTEILTGYTDGSLKPKDLITREQIATMLYRFEKNQGGGLEEGWSGELNFSDAASISSYAFEAMYWCNQEGIVTGVTETTLVPKATADRGQFVTMLYRYAH